MLRLHLDPESVVGLSPNVVALLLPNSETLD
jgi:hypothetical protein